jgi:hypothetical protein
VGHVKRTCPDLSSGAIVNARYANAPAKQKGQDLSNVECYTCHKKGHYSNKCSERQPGGALGTCQDGKSWCSHHQTNTHSSEECWHLHPHLKDQGGERQKGKGRQSNARSVEAANSGGSRVSVPSRGLMNFIFRGVFAQGLDSKFFMTVQTQGPTMYPSWSAIYLQDGMHWTPGEKGERLARNQVVPTEAQAQSPANGTELTADELEQFAWGLVILVDWLVDLPVIPPETEAWEAETRRTHKNHVEYRLPILRYIAAMTESILAETCRLDEQSTTEHRLLVEFYWMLHKIPEYLVQTNCMDCCEGLDHTGERQAGLQELWDIIAKTNPAGVQTLQRHMMLQLGALERGGCIRLDQVWSAPINEELAEVYLVAKQMMLDVLGGPSKKFQERALAIQAELHAVLLDLAKSGTQTGRSRARRERSPFLEMVESDVKATGKIVVESRQTKRAREEKGAQKAARRTLTPPKPDYKLVSPEVWEQAKQTEGTYRYDHKEWCENERDPWSIRGNRAGTLQKRATLFVRIPSVVQVCCKVSGKSPAFEIYVPLPPARTPGKGNIIMLNSLKGLEDLCYYVSDLAMFVPEANLEGVDIVKKWHDDTKSRVTDLDEATTRLAQYVIERGNEQVDVNVYGPATDSGKQEQEALVQEQGTHVQGREEACRGAGGTQVRTVAQESAFTMAHVEPVAEEKQSVSAATLSGAAQTASHPNVAHFTDTLVRMGYLQDFQNGVYLLSNPLGTELMGQRNKVAKHIKSKADAEEAMLVLCREGKMEFVNNGLFRIPHFEEDEKPLGQDKASSGSSEHQPLKKKAKKVQAKPKVRKSVQSEPCHAAYCRCSVASMA